MRFKSSLAAAVIVAFAATTAPAVQAATGALFVNENGEPTLAPVIQEVSPAIVNIATRGMVEDGVENPLFKDPLFGELLPGQPDGQGQPAQSVGSGVIVDADNDAQGLVVHLQRFGSVLCRFGIVRDDEGDGITHIAHFIEA